MADSGCSKCGGSFKWPASFKSGPIPIPSHIVDTAIYCQFCREKFCIRCFCGECPECGGKNYKHVSPSA